MFVIETKAYRGEVEVQGDVLRVRRGSSELDSWRADHIARRARASAAELHRATGRSGGWVSSVDHIETLEDEEILWGAVLVHSFALAQSAIADRVEIDMRCASGIEDWGRRFLRANGKSWRDVKGGLGGAVEVAVVRNAVSHGTRRLDETAANRLKQAGSKPERRAGSKLTLSYQHLRGYRNRLEDLLKVGGLG